MSRNADMKTNEAIVSPGAANSRHRMLRPHPSIKAVGSVAGKAAKGGFKFGVGFFTDFKHFLTKGNIIELAIGVMIAAAFQAIINSLVKDILSPLIGLAAMRNFDELYVTLRRPSNMTKADDPASVDDAIKAGLNIMTYGHFITAVLTFLITGFALFLLIKFISLVWRKKEEAKPDTKECPYCLQEVLAKASRCLHCTSELEVESMPHPLTPSHSREPLLQ